MGDEGPISGRLGREVSICGELERVVKADGGHMMCVVVLIRCFCTLQVGDRGIL